MPTSLHNHHPRVKIAPLLLQWYEKNRVQNSSWGWVIDWGIGAEPDYGAAGIRTNALWASFPGRPTLLAFVIDGMVRTLPLPSGADYADMIRMIDEYKEKHTP